MELTAPFVYFGGKKSVADMVWQAFSDIENYVEPFFGSGAVLLARPAPIRGPETVNDINAYVANFWRALQADPKGVEHWTINPAFENDMHARHAWLVSQEADLRARLEGSPEFYDVKIAGWWVWGLSMWVGGLWCSGDDGPWCVVDGKLIRTEVPHSGISRRRIFLGGSIGVYGRFDDLPAWFEALRNRLKDVRVCCGEWWRVCRPVPTTYHGRTGVFFDPPYLHGPAVDRLERIYSKEDGTCANDVRAWCLEHGDNPLFRIVLCGYEGEHDMPATWQMVEWKAQGGYANAGDGRGRVNTHRERLWLSPHCVKVEAQVDLFMPDAPITVVMPEVGDAPPIEAAIIETREETPFEVAPMTGTLQASVEWAETEAPFVDRLEDSGSNFLAPTIQPPKKRREHGQKGLF